MSHCKYEYCFSADVLVKQRKDFYLEADSDNEAIVLLSEEKGICPESIKLVYRKRLTNLRCPVCGSSPVLNKVANGGYTLWCTSCRYSEYGGHIKSPVFYGETEEEVYNVWEKYVEDTNNGKANKKEKET